MRSLKSFALRFQRSLRRSFRRLLGHRLDGLAWRILWGRGNERVPVPYPPGYFYSPLPSREDIESSRRQDPCPSSMPAIDLNLDGQLDLLTALKPFYDEQPFSLHPASGMRYSFKNEGYPCADAIVLHCLLREFEPRRLIEVGSGWSTCVTLDTAERFLPQPIDLTLIEPYADILRGLVRPGDLDSIDLHELRLQDVPLSLFDTLEEGDVLFVDSTHVAKTGSDVNRLVFEILPRLAPGVHVHLHDICYPFEYPDAWVDLGWGWNEAYLVRAFLQYNRSFTVEFFTDMLRKREAQRLSDDYPLLLESPGSNPRISPPGSLWLLKTA
jgi:hypothetical protein